MHLFRPWLNRRFKPNTLFLMRVDYIIHHLDHYDKKKVLANNSWQAGKERRLAEQIIRGKNPLRIEPIRMVLHASKHRFRVEDGISRLRVFRNAGIKKIRVLLRLGEW